MKNSFSSILHNFFIITVFGLLFIYGCGQNSNPTFPKFETEYQAVFLGNGQVIFGKSEILGKDYILLKDVFYIRSQANEQTKQVTNTLIKKGKEWHGAEQMYINTRHIIMIEPVSPESQVARLIKEQKAQRPSGTQ